jgi:hypothetical protein
VSLELIEELTAALKARDAEEKKYKAWLSEHLIQKTERKSALADAEQKVKEIEAELTSPGKSDRPILAAIAEKSRGGSKPKDDEEPDEHQRGPTSFPSATAAAGQPAANGPPASQPKQLHRPAGPLNQDAALLLATTLPEVAGRLGELAVQGGTDDEIYRILIQWPTVHHPGTAQGNAWAVRGGSSPAFWYDTAALDHKAQLMARKPARTSPTLEDQPLVAAVRRLLKIKKPKASQADSRPVRGRGRPRKEAAAQPE